MYFFTFLFKIILIYFLDPIFKHFISFIQASILILKKKSHKGFSDVVFDATCSTRKTLQSLNCGIVHLHNLLIIKQ